MVAQQNALASPPAAESTAPVYDTGLPPFVTPAPVSESWRHLTADDLADLAAELAEGGATVGPALRRLVEATIDALIGILDAIDPDPDLEPNLAGAPLLWTTETELEADSADDEPSLGATACIDQEAAWHAGEGWQSWVRDDREADDDFELQEVAA